MFAEVSRQAGISDRRPALWLLSAQELVDESFAQQLTLDSIADFVSIHPVHLAREFRRHFKYTVGEYMRLRRVEYACRELSVGKATVAEIALAAGFADQSHLTRTFKRVVGTTPAEYRKAVKD
jgi:AraC family transcriptional regulator